MICILQTVMLTIICSGLPVIAATPFCAFSDPEEIFVQELPNPQHFYDNVVTAESTHVYLAPCRSWEPPKSLKKDLRFGRRPFRGAGAPILELAMRRSMRPSQGIRIYRAHGSCTIVATVGEGRVSQREWYEADIPCTTLETLQELWIQMLTSVRDAKDPQIVDGTRYYARMPAEAEEYSCGQAHSPAHDTPAGRFAEVGKRLFAYATEQPTNRKRLHEEILGLARHAIDILKRDQSSNNRMSPTIQPVTVRAVARPTPGGIAGYPQR